MRGFLARLLINALGLWAADTVLAGIGFTGWPSLLIAALLLGIVNATVRPLIFVLTLPVTLVTLGLFLLVVNGISLAVVAWLVPGFTVSSLFAATLGALLVMPASSRPGSRMPTRSQISASSVRMWELMRIALPASANLAIISRSSMRARGSSPAVGSSSTSTEGSWIIVRPRHNRCFIPFDRPSMGFMASSSSCVNSITSSIARSRRCPVRP